MPPNLDAVMGPSPGLDFGIQATRRAGCRLSIADADCEGMGSAA
ncbi:MAG: hypothetical protein ACU837_06445 [Gammaproteobacteria bacterium]